jgi:hypothetical protein
MLQCKKIYGFSHPAGISLTELSLAGNDLVSDIPAGDEKIAGLFLQCIVCIYNILTVVSFAFFLNLFNKYILFFGCFSKAKKNTV